MVKFVQSKRVMLKLTSYLLMFVVTVIYDSKGGRRMMIRYDKCCSWFQKKAFFDHIAFLLIESEQ